MRLIYKVFLILIIGLFNGCSKVGEYKQGLCQLRNIHLETKNSLSVSLGAQRSKNNNTMTYLWLAYIPNSVSEVLADKPNVILHAYLNNKLTYNRQFIGQKLLASSNALNDYLIKKGHHAAKDPNTEPSLIMARNIWGEIMNVYKFEEQAAIISISNNDLNKLTANDYIEFIIQAKDGAIKSILRKYDIKNLIEFNQKCAVNIKK